MGVKSDVYFRQFFSVSSLFKTKKILVEKTTSQNFHSKIQCILKKLKRVTNVLRVFSGLNPYNSFKKNAPEAIRTPDLRIRNPLLYPAELRGLIYLQRVT